MFRLTHKTLNGLAALSLLALGCTSTSAPPPGDADAAEPLEVSESRTEETSTGDDIDALEPPADIHDSTDGWEALSACDGAYGEPLETLKLPAKSAPPPPLACSWASWVQPCPAFTRTSATVIDVCTAS